MLCKICQTLLFRGLVKGEYDKRLTYHTTLESFTTAANNGCYICQPLLRVSSGEVSDIKNRLGWPQTFYFCHDMVEGLKLRIQWSQIPHSHPYPRIIRFEPTPANVELTPDTMARSQSGLPTDAITLAATRWITTCLEKHSCINNEPPASYPTRLLQIDASTIRLVCTAEGDPVGPYAALSYCWGPNPQFLRLTTSNEEQFRRGIPLNDLPVAFQEAIDLLRSLSFRLLWIDALCIIQDSNDDWLHESARMYQVYSECQLNLSLSRSESPNESCLSGWIPDEIQSFPLDTASFHHDSNPKPPIAGRKFLVHPQNNNDALNKQPLEQRAWAFQERLLASRVLSFGRGEMFWSCAHLPMASETFPDGCQLGRSDSDLLTETLTQFWQPSRSSMDSMRAIPAEEKLNVWGKAVRSYRARQLTYPERDSLVAIAAIARALTPPDDPYIAGHFRSTLPRSLTWVSTSSWEGKNLKSQRKLHGGGSPAWSWASVKKHRDNPNVPYLYSFNGPCEADLATLQSYCLEPVDHDNPYGQIAFASLTLKCNAIPFYWTRDLGPEHQGVGEYLFNGIWKQISSRGRNLWKNTMVENDCWFTPDDEGLNLPEGTELQAIPLVQIHEASRFTGLKSSESLWCVVRCLVARRRTRKDKHVYERIGLLLLGFSVSCVKGVTGYQEGSSTIVRRIPLLSYLRGWEWKSITLV